MQGRHRFLQFYRSLKKHRLLFWVLTLTCTVLSVCLMSFFLVPQYESRAQVIVNQHLESDEQVDIYSMNQLETNLQLINTYGDIIFGYQVLEEVNQRLGEQYTVDELSSVLTLNHSPDSQAFYVRAHMESPQEAQQVLNKFIEVFQELLIEIYEQEISSVVVLSEASYNPNPVAPSIGRFTFIGAVIGIFISIIVINLIELSDPHIRSSEDLVQFGMNNLGEINLLTKNELKYSRASHVNDKY